MVDEFFDRYYREARSDLSAAIVALTRRLGRAVVEVFVVLNRIEYSAPWTVNRERARLR